MNNLLFVSLVHVRRRDMSVVLTQVLTLSFVRAFVSETMGVTNKANSTLHCDRNIHVDPDPTSHVITYLSSSRVSMKHGEVMTKSREFLYKKFMSFPVMFSCQSGFPVQALHVRVGPCV